MVMRNQQDLGVGATKDDCQMAMLCHLLGFAGLAIPFGNFIGPLVVWLLKKNQHPLIDDQGKESLNFQITYTLFGLVLLSGLIFSIVTAPEAYLRWITILTLLVVFTFVYVILMIIACLQANKGLYHRYPATIRLIA
jgi:uncharacterized Tic20 family protein